MYSVAGFVVACLIRPKMYFPSLWNCKLCPSWSSLGRFDDLCIIKDEIFEEVDLPQEMLHGFLIHEVSNMHDGMNSFRIYLDPNFSNDVSKQVTLRHYEDALLWIHGYHIFSTLLKKIVKMAWMVWLLSREYCHIIEVDHYALSDKPTECDVHCMLKCCTCVHQPQWHSKKIECTPLSTELFSEFVNLCYLNFVVSENLSRKENISALETICNIFSMDGTK